MSKNYTNYNKINKLDSQVNASEAIEESVNDSEIFEENAIDSKETSPINTQTKHVANCARVYMRAHADKDSESIDILDCGIEVSVLDSENGFSLVSYNGVAGWIMSDYLIGD